MSACSTSVLDAVALQLLEALKEYEEESGALLGAWPRTGAVPQQQRAHTQRKAKPAGGDSRG